MSGTWKPISGTSANASTPGDTGPSRSAAPTSRKPTAGGGRRPLGIPALEDKIVQSDEQRALLAEVSQFAGKGSLIPPERRYELTGWAAPHAGGPKSQALTPAEKARDREVRLAISEEMGHHREEITAVYLGR